MTGLLFFLMLLGGAAWIATLNRRLDALRDEVGRLQDRMAMITPMVAPTSDFVSYDPAVAAGSGSTPDPAPVRQTARVVSRRAASAPSIVRPWAELEPEPTFVPPEPDRPPREPFRLSFERIVGGRLPIWIGGAALVLSGFFLVRYSIENGLLGPAARTIIAALFGLLLVAASEVARRLAVSRDDPRIAQALAGAGVASLYGTLYMAAELYHLIGAGSAFALMTILTVAALALALRHGPPTAIMALIGGFSAPLIAGFNAAGIGPLLVYLALLVAALLGLAIRRGWLWLALAAIGGGFVWVNLLLALTDGHGLGGAGAFVILLAIAAALVLPRAGASHPWLRVSPLVAGLIQLVALAPALDFGPLAWALYLLLSAATLWLAWRDELYAPGAAVALALVVILIGLALDRGEQQATPLAAFIATALFAIPGHLRGRRAPIWTTLALGGAAAPLLAAWTIARGLTTPAIWAALMALAVVASASLAWRDREKASATPAFAPVLTVATALAALLAAIGLYEITPEPWLWPAWLAIAVLLAGWARRIDDRSTALMAALPLLCVALLALGQLGLLSAYLDAVFAPGPMPPLADLVAIGVLPALLVAATALLLPPGLERATIGWIAWLLALGLLGALLPAAWTTPALALAALIGMLSLRLPLIGPVTLAIALFAALPLLGQFALAIGSSLTGDHLPYLLLPPIGAVLRELGLSIFIAAAAFVIARDALGRWRPIVGAVTIVVATLVLYDLAKQPLAIATPSRFVALGFVERAVVTQAAFVVAWLLRSRALFVARAFMLLALARFVYFDLLLLDPAIVRQSVGTVPILNTAFAHIALVSLWLWYWPGVAARRAALAAMLLIVMVAVRQASHGADLTGDLGRTENWLYSAGFLGLALVWLWRGLAGSAAADLRLAGLALLTLVTLKVFLIDAAALEGILRILSFLGLGLALIGIGWGYGRATRREAFAA